MKTRIIAFLLVLSVSVPAAAQVGRFEVQRFHPASSQSAGYISTESGAPGLEADFEAGLFPHFSLDPLKASDVDGEEHAVIGQQLVTHVWLAYSPASFLRLAADMPLYALQSGDEAALGISDGSLDGSGLGDLRLITKLGLLERPESGGAALSLLIPVSLPTGDAQLFQGEGARVEPGFAFDITSGRYGLGANLGYLIRDEATVGNLIIDDQVTYKVAGRIPVAQDLVGLIEFAGAVDVAGGDLRIEESPLEALGALRYDLGSGSITAGVGGGVLGGVGAPALRTFIGYAYRPVASAGGSFPMEPMLTDRDGDRIPDDTDKCPDDPEDYDRFQDDDGCPDADNDKDGIADLDDTCPMKPEDKDGFRDDDGCPDDDNDGDGILDSSDKCPSEPEDRDRFEDEDGCPDDDNDKDGVADLDDACPNAAGAAEDAGCPNAGAGPAVTPLAPAAKGDVLDTVIYFSSGSSALGPAARAQLHRLAKRLNLDTNIKRLGIYGHTDDRSGDRANLRLSQRRAKASRDFLISKGVDADRLELLAYGETKPTDSNETQDGRQANRRVEFLVLE
jgi:outer membrane protein OmpA-like peptidoglycan-associated protein